MIKRFLTIAILLFACIFVLKGQPRSTWLPMNINNESGLSNSAVTNIYMDAKGIMWFGTWDGLNRYDGSEINVFKPDAFRAGQISNNIIRDFLEDKSNNFWIITDDGINRLDSNNMQFTSYLSNNKKLPKKEYNLKACLGTDSLVYVSLYGYGLAYYNAKVDSFIKLDLPGLSVQAQKEIIGLYGQPEGILFLLTEHGVLYTYNQNKKTYETDLTRYHELLFEKHWFVKINSTFYLAIALKKGGVLLYNLSTYGHTVLLKDHLITTMNETFRKDMLWAGTDGGSIFKINFNNNAPAAENMDSWVTDLLSNHVKIWTIKQTSEDLLWVGTDGKGVYRYITKGKPFYNIKKDDKQPGSISHNIVRAIIKDQEGNLWIGTRGGGFNMIPGNSKNTKYYNVSNGLSNNAVISLGFDNRKNLWIGVDGEGIDMMEKNTGKILHFPRDFANTSKLEFGSVYSICVDVYGSVWLGTSGYGIVCLDVEKKADGSYYLTKYKQIRYSRDIKGLKSDIIYSIVEEQPNVLWIGTRGGGLHRLNTLNNSFEVYGKTDDGINSLSNDDILSLCIGKNDKLWIGTSGGLNMLDFSHKPYQFKHFTEYDGLPNNTVHGILEDSNGNIWLSTNRGLSKLNVSENSFINFNKADGLQNNEYTDGAVYNDTPNKLLYFGGVEGIDWFNPQQIKQAGHFPPIVLNEFRLYNNPVLPGDSSLILSKSLNETTMIKLKHNQNFFSFSFSTLNYYNASKCEFAYCLEGFDYDWNYIQTKRTANFTNVPPGTYTFKLKATNEDGIFGKEVREVKIIINPSVWNTGYAYVLYFLLSSLTTYSVIAYSRKRIREKREREIEKIHQQKKDEINRYKLQFFTNIAHEFRTPLTLILAPAATLMNYIKEEKHLEVYARTIYQNANRLQRLIQELIEFRKVETGNTKLEIRKHELVEYVGELVRAFEQFARQNDIALRFFHSETTIEAWVDIKKLEKILLNLISNAIKYTPKGGSVEVKLELQKKELLFTVKDTGIGIPEDMREKVFDRFFHDSGTLPRSNIAQEGTGVGLSLTKSLVELHKGTITVENSPEGGSIFKVLLSAEKTVYENDIIEDEFVVQTDRIAKNVLNEIQASHDYQFENQDSAANNMKRKYTILIVDDNQQVCNLIGSLLVNEYNIFKAHNSYEALEIIDTEHIDLMISDVIMPGMDGLELCFKVKSDINTCHIPVILLTAKGELEQRIEGIEAGADSYIPKPFHPDHLLVRIKKLLETRERFRMAYKEYNETSQDELLKGLSPKDKQLLSGLSCFIEENIEDSSLNADHLASHLAMSKTQLYRKIKALTDFTPHGLIKHIRLKKAAALLQEDEKTVSEVFYETGFNNRTYFYRSFKEAYGVTPGEYLRSKRG